MRRVVVLLATLCALHANDVQADKATSEALEKEAEALATAGDFVGAAAKYRDAYASDPRVELRCNVGIAYHKAKELPRAQLYLSLCLDRGTVLDAEFVAAVRGVLAIVEGAIKTGDFTPVDIVLEPKTTEVTIEDVSFVGSRLVWLPYGAHALVFKAEGYIDQTITITTAARDTTPLSIKLEKKPDPKPMVPRIERRERSMIPAIAASVFTVGALIYAGYCYNEAHSRADIAVFATTDAQFDDDRDVIETYNTRLAISAGLAVLGAAASGFFWYRALTPTTKVEVVPTTTGATVTFRVAY